MVKGSETTMPLPIEVRCKHGHVSHIAPYRWKEQPKVSQQRRATTAVARSRVKRLEDISPVTAGCSGTKLNRNNPEGMNRNDRTDNYLERRTRIRIRPSNCGRNFFAHISKWIDDEAPAAGQTVVFDFTEGRRGPISYSIIAPGLRASIPHKGGRFRGSYPGCEKRCKRRRN